MKAPRIKFCGITREQDAELAVSLGAWAVGLIMWRHSPRAVPLDRAAGLAASLKRRAEVVGVFVNPTLDELAATADAVGLTMLQLHGQEGPSFCTEAARRTGCKVIKAARVHSGADIQALAAYHTDFHMLDSYRAGVPGGTGEAFAWDLAAGHRRLPRPRGSERVPLILSGGLTPENVAAGIAAVRPFAVDVASGVESAPGHKDAEKMRRFAAAVASTAEMDPASSGGLDPASSGALDPASSGGLDPASSGGLDPASSGGLDPASSGGLDPASSGGLDPASSDAQNDNDSHSRFGTGGKAHAA